MSHRFAAAWLAAALSTGQAQAAAELLPFQVTESTLANGLKVIVVPTGLPNLVSLQISVQVGARNETEPGKTGFAHFFEHMMFRGTAAYPAERYNAILKQAGASSNAYTSDDYTNYHTTFAKADLETLLTVEADRFRHLSYSEDVFKTEARAVLGEYNKNSSNPGSRLFEVTREVAFDVHTYKHTAMGFVADIEDMPNQYAYSKLFFERWYRPEYTTIIVAGDVQAAPVLALVDKYWGGWQRGRHRAEVAAEPARRGAVYKHVSWPLPTTPRVSVSFRAPRFSTTDRDQAALAMLMSLSFGPSSALHKRLVQDEQLVEGMGQYLPDRADPTLATVNARVRRIADVVAVRDAILQTAARLRSEPVSARVLADAKAAERYELLRSLDTTEHVAGMLAGYVRFERSYTTLGRYFRLLDTLTPDDLRNAAQRYFVDDGLVVTTLSNGEMPAAMATLPSLARLDRRRDDSRIALTLQPSPLPQIRMKLLFSAGSAQDPPGKEGLAALTAAMVAEAGSSERSFDDVKQALFPLAGVFNAQVDKEMSTFTGNVHPERWREFVDIVMPMLLSPGFREADFQRLKARQANALTVDLKGTDDEELAKERLQANVYAGTPYGHPVLGTEKSIDGLTLDDVRSFHRRAYTQGALRVGLAGPADAAMAAALKQLLVRLPAEPALPATAVPAGRATQGLAVEIIEKETRATALSFGLPLSVTRSHPDFVALSVARSWLGEHRNWSSHLFKRIREERGMNYGDYAYIEAFPHSGWQDVPTANVARKAQLFEVWIRPVTTTENAHFALRIALAEIDRLVEQGLTAAQFEATREFLSKYVFLMTASQDAQLGYALDAQWYGAPEFTTMMRDGLARLTLADVNAAIRRHLSARNLSVVIVTKDAADMKARLLDDRFSAMRYDGNKPADLLAEDQVIGARKLAIRPQAVTVTPLSRVFAE